MPPPGGGGFPPPPPPPDPGPGQIVVSGTVSFDNVPFSATAADGLDFANTDDQAPVRGATVEAIDDATGNVLGITQTDGAGAYAFALPANFNVHMRVKAELVRAGTPAWDFRVLDNTDGSALYALDGPAFNTGAVATLDIGDLHAPSGWNVGAGQYDQPRSAAPFAILDMAYQNIGFILATDADSIFAPLELFWSPGNNPSNGTGDPEVDFPAGDIGTTFYWSEDPVAGLPAAIYILGAADTDTDEFDRHVLAHEWGHYFQENFARDDTLGGSHSLSSKLDLTVAFSEAWGDAFSAMASDDPLYRDSFGGAQANDFQIDMESNALGGANPGWFSEGSIASVLYDLYDDDVDGETAEVSFTSIRAALEGTADTDSLTSIYPFVLSLVSLEPAQAAAIEALLTAQQIEPQPLDDFGPNETNNGGNANNLPPYTVIAVGGTQRLCTTGSPTEYYNALGNRRYLRLDVAMTQPVTITVAGAAPNASFDPDIFIYAQGEELGGDEAIGPSTITGLTLDPGTYVIEAYDSRWIEPDTAGTRCFNVTVTSP